jgi:hypothetical protein
MDGEMDLLRFCAVAGAGWGLRLRGRLLDCGGGDIDMTFGRFVVPLGRLARRALGDVTNPLSDD